MLEISGPLYGKISIRRYLNHNTFWRIMAKQILKIILSLGAVALSLLCGLNAEKLFVKNLGLVTIPVPNREIEPYTVIAEDMFTTTEFTGYIKDFDYAVSYSSLDGRMTTGTLAAGLPVPMAFISQAAGFYMDDPKLESMDGYTDPSIKRIVISDVHRRPDDPENVQDQDWFQRNIIRHELIHAFVVESGCQDALWHSEDMVRWLAYMFPRLLAAFNEAGAMDHGKGVVLDGVYHPTTDELKKMFSHSPDILPKDGSRLYPEAPPEAALNGGWPPR